MVDSDNTTGNILNRLIEILGLKHMKTRKKAFLIHFLPVWM